MTRRRAVAGFTLVEIVVALALAALVSLILLQGMRFTASGYARVARHADRLDERASLAALLRRTLAAAAPARFTGDPDRVSFVTIADDGRPGLYRLDLALLDGRLVLTRRLATPFGDPEMQRSILAEAVRHLRMAYFGAAGPTDAPVWRERWRANDRLPQLVRIELDTGGDGEGLPPLLVRLWGAG